MIGPQGESVELSGTFPPDFFPQWHCLWGIIITLSGSSSAVERQLPKLDVAGSIPVSRSIFFRSFAHLTRQVSSSSAFCYTAERATIQMGILTTKSGA
jgi:hypothetical protein